MVSCFKVGATGIVRSLSQKNYWQFANIVTLLLIAFYTRTRFLGIEHEYYVFVVIQALSWMYVEAKTFLHCCEQLKLMNFVFIAYQQLTISAKTG